MFWAFWWPKRVFLCVRNRVLWIIIRVFFVIWLMFSMFSQLTSCSPVMTQLEKKINFGPKHTFFVIHGRSQMTFMTELEKVIIFRPKHKFFVIHGGPKWTFRCLNWHNSTEGKLKQNSVKVDFPRLQVDALYCICINIICIVSFLRASILSASSTFKLQSASSKFWNIAWR